MQTPSHFQFMFDDKELEEGELSKFEVLSILKGNLDPLQHYSECTAYTNLSYKLAEHPNPVDSVLIGKVLRLQQMAVQLLRYKLELNLRKTAMYRERMETERAQK